MEEKPYGQIVTQKKKEKRLHKIGKDTVGDYIIIGFLIVFAFIAFFPVWYTIVGSLNNGSDYERGGVIFWPRVFTIANYSAIVADERIWQGLLITVLRVLTGPILSVLFTAFVAYGMGRKELHFKKAFNFLNLFTMFFAGGLIPYYLLCRSIGLLNTFWVYIIPSAYNVYNMILVRAFFKSTPEELHEAAVVDGASEFRIFATIMLPCSMPVLATLFMWSLIGHWNDYLTSEIYVSTREELHVLQYVVQKIINESGTEVSTGLPTVIKDNVSTRTISLAAMMLTSIPMFIAFPFLQKFFTKGLYVGSLKG